MVLSPPTDANLEGRVLVIPGAGAIAPPDAATPADIQALVDRVEAAEAATLGGLSDVDTTGAADGMILAAVDTAGTITWEPAAAPQGIDIANATTAILLDAGYIDFSESFTVADNGDGGVAVFPRTGTTAGTIAAGDHLHTLPTKQRFPLADPASQPPISSGRRTLITATIGTFAVGVGTLIEVDSYADLEGIDDPSQLDYFIIIDGTEDNSSSVPRVQPKTAEWGVNAERTWQAAKTITRTSSGTGSSGTRTITFGIDWRGGSSVKVISAYIWVKTTAAR